MLDINMNETLITDTIEYKGKKIKFSLKEFDGKKEKKNVTLMWYVEAQIEGFKKPFMSKLMTSLFARDSYDAAKQLSDPQDFLNALFLDAKRIENTKCELLAASLDEISIMWYNDGKVQIETDTNLLKMIKNLIDHLDTDVSKLVLTNSGFI